MPAKPMLDDVELQLIQKLTSDDQEVLAEHGVPALEGDFLQDLGRRVTRVSLTGVMTGAEAGDSLKTLREKFRAAAPVTFVADIATATKVGKVLIEELGVRELAGKPERFEYELTLREFLPAPQPEQEAPPPPPPEPELPDVETGTLIVEVTVEGQPAFDFSKVTLTVKGTREDGTELSQALTNRSDNVWTEEQMALGRFTVEAVVTDPPALSGSTPAAVQAGATTRSRITLNPGAIIAKTFVAHFRFDNAFLEPCMREVAQRVARFAAAQNDHKLLIVGNTDEVGSPTDLTASDPYNQSLSERRARSAFAYSTFGTDANASKRDWKALRQAQAGLPTLGDKWGVRQYQYMLQALGFYPGNIDADHGPLTSDAVRSFREAKALPPGSTVDDAVWDALIADYLAQGTRPTPGQFLPNANAANGCDGGILKWLGLASQDPVNNIRAAHRPNRRAEFLFVRTDRFPDQNCRELEPDTFNLPSAGAVNPAWCLGPGSRSTRTCFVVKHLPAGAQPQGNQWVRQPAEPGTVTVRGSIKFEDGTPAPNVKYVLIAPDGEFMDGEQSNGEGIPGRTRADGTFDYPSKPKGVGTYTMEIEGPFIARLEGEPISAAKGSVVCKLMDGSSNFNVVVRSLTATVNPQITPASAVVVVKKTYTNPARQIVTVKTDGPFFRSGTVTRVGTAIRFFDAAVNGTEITFNGTDNVFTGSRLTAGVQLFAESTTPSVALDDVELTLTLIPGATPIGPPATATMTAVELTLDVALSRTAAGVDPPLMPQPPAVTPAPGTATDKVNLGRFVQLRDSSFSHERAMLIIQPPNPAAFAGALLLTPINGQVEAFVDEVPAAGQNPVTPLPFAVPVPVPLGGTRLFVQGTGVSNAARDTGLQLGIQGVEVEADRVAMTTTELATTGLATPVAPALTFARFGLWDNAFVGGAVQNGLAEAGNFVGADKRRFHLRVRGPLGAGSVSVDWKTLRADRVTDDDAPAPATPADFPLRVTLPATGAGSPTFISRGLMLVTDDTDMNFPTHSGLIAPFDIGLRNSGQSNHRTRRAAIDGFVHSQFQPAPGQNHHIVLPVFDRAVPFSTTAANNIGVGAQVVTPAAMSGTAATGARWSIKVGTRLTIDTGANQEVVVVTALTAVTFTATFTLAHNGTAAPFAISGTTDERRQVAVRVIRYINPANPAFPVATPANIAGQFQHANDRWNTVACRINPSATGDRQIPAGALDAAGLYGGAINNAFEQAVLSDLIRIITDDTITVVFVAKSGANAYSVTFPRNPIPQPVGPPLTLGERHFIFINAGLNPVGDTLAHELHHVLFNRGDNGVNREFITFNTQPSASFGIPLPDVRVRRRIHDFHTADPDIDPNNDNVINWVRRRRTARFPAVGTLGDLNPVADTTTGNRLTQDF